MKLPIDFGNRFFFRVVFPGAILSASLFRMTYTVLLRDGLIDYLTYVFAAQIFVLGWLFVMLDMPIYMLFEGRRYWPTFALRFFHARERLRVLRLHKRMRQCFDAQIGKVAAFDKMNAQRRYLEAAVEISNFPLHSTTCMPCADWPTRLGNLIASYEQYPRLKYGLDSVFFWPRIWVSIDQPLRDEIDNYQAQADGLLYSVVAMIASGLLFIGYGLVDVLWPGHLHPLYPPGTDFLIATICLAFSLIVYRMSLHSHRQFGELFKAVFDQHRAKLLLSDNIEFVSHMTGDTSLLTEIEIKKNNAVWRFLRWHRVRLPTENRNRRVRLP